ncbi:MAG: hypothetical protein WBM00_03850, partial [Solirubrobacterales bacterium]
MTTWSRFLALSAAVMLCAITPTGCGGGGGPTTEATTEAVSRFEAEEAVRPAFEEITNFQEGSHSPAGQGDFLI